VARPIQVPGSPGCPDQALLFKFGAQAKTCFLGVDLVGTGMDTDGPYGTARTDQSLINQRDRTPWTRVDENLQDSESAVLRCLFSLNGRAARPLRAF
jgi:hypothetical protein